MRFSFSERPIRRRPSLTPMIDVVFLLLVFFMLAARFGQETEIRLAAPGSTATPAEWQGAPRLVTIGADRLALNGMAVPLEGLADRLRPLVPEPGAPVVLLPEEGADLQRLLDVMTTLEGALDATLIVGEGAE